MGVPNKKGSFLSAGPGNASWERLQFIWILKSRNGWCPWGGFWIRLEVREPQGMSSREWPLAKMPGAGAGSPRGERCFGEGEREPGR